MRAAVLLVLTIVLAGCASTPDAPAASTPTPSVTGPGGCEAPVLDAPEATWIAQKPRVRVDTTKGSFVVELDMEQAPLTAANFLDLTRSGFYNGTLFHRVIRDFVIQAGDPLSKDDDPANDGTGDAGYEIADEFHPALRHDAVGVLSMANSGPNTGSSQFFVTLAPTPHLDDRHAVFGRVVEGLDVVRSIGAQQVDANDRPLEEMRIVGAEEIAPRALEAAHGVGAHVIVAQKKAAPERTVRFAVILQNTGITRDLVALGAAPPSGWTCAIDAPVVVSAGTARVVFLALIPPAGATGSTNVPLKVTSASGATGSAALTVVVGELGAAVKMGDRVTGNYAGVLLDGRLFDTSFPSVGNDPAQPKFNTTGGFRARPSYSTFPFTVGSGVIDGFTNLAQTAREGEIVTGFIPAKDAYATGNQYERPLTGRDLVFELEIVKIG